jgi:exodeoxyribonuclease V alpha subunit
LAQPDRDRLTTIVGRLLVAQATGGTRLAVTDDERTLLARAPDLVAVTSAAGHAPLALDSGYLYTQRSHACELRVASRLVALRAPGPFSPASLAAAVADAAATGEPTPSDEQKGAVVAALGRRLGVIAGGPGTGKTTTALLVVRARVRLGVPPASIALAAPTGKAKSRLEEGFRSRLEALADRALLAGCPEAQTLHHLLGATIGPGGFARSAGVPLPYRAVIVDESSMVDLVLMDQLLAALPDGCQLVLLGDADQLPSVSAGAVFRDLGALATTLRRGFRADPDRPTGAELAALAQAVRDGQADAAVGRCATREDLAALRRQGAEHLPAAYRDPLLFDHHRRLFAEPCLAAAGERAFVLAGDRFADEEAVSLDALAAAHARTRVLGVTRQGPAGVERCNQLLHDLAGGGPGFLPGEPLLMLRNDYQRELWNGEPGVAVRARRPGHAAATVCAFRSRRGWLAVDPVVMGGAVGLGYALTVHKAQGSEHDQVLLLLPDYDCPLLTRELVYTAVSRARTAVVLCGSLDRLAAGIARRTERASGIAERLESGAPRATLDTPARVR